MLLQNLLKFLPLSNFLFYVLHFIRQVQFFLENDLSSFLTSLVIFQLITSAVHSLPPHFCLLLVVSSLTSSGRSILVFPYQPWSFQWTVKEYYHPCILTISLYPSALEKVYSALTSVTKPLIYYSFFILWVQLFYWRSVLKYLLTNQQHYSFTILTKI